MGANTVARSIDDRQQDRARQVPDGRQIDAAATFLAFRAGNGRALETLMNCFGPMMSSVARRYLRCGHDVEDAVQDAWVSFTRAAHRIENPMAIGGWLKVTTAHAALGIARRQARCTPSDLPFDTALPAEAAEADTLDETEAHAVRGAVSRLRPQQRELVALLFDSDPSYSEISAQVGRPVGSIGPTRQRLIAKLRRDRSIRELASLRAC